MKHKVSRVANGGGFKALSTSSVRLCEKKNDVDDSLQVEKTNADKDTEPTETPTVVTQRVEDDSNIIKMAEHREEEPVVIKTDEGSTTQQQVDFKIEQVVTTPIQVKTNAAKSGKESLLDLLGGMKVEVTNKRKLKNIVTPSYESTPKPKPAAMESTISMFQKATVEASSQKETLDPKLVAAASAAASTLPDRSQAESELLRQLRHHDTITEAQKKGDVNNLGVIIADMKVGKNPNRQNARPSNQIRFDDDGRGYTHDRGITAELDARPTLWDMDFANQLSLSTNQMPRNGLEEMIQWTKEGKMWQYPINNEAGLEEEASVPFNEHIFLEKHLEEGFARQGPVRHFMELVVTGLSRNPFLTVQQKREHISWFRDYFHQKEEVLKEADVCLN
ncbi:28S ribosomal protein S31, mitochondrial [Liparis tanakae]|uniref:Small ribosomal subunit protein mS31 n=1 Tax=Liparis tanakae TaxID=230148 RepID=A0A4Z2I5I8_9TELE|nr:28S ribosomal protein S31, mitochondrial [Liparis tanakae]